MIDDVFSLAKTLETGFMDVQADAATAIAGLTSDGEVVSSSIVVLSLAFHTVADLLIDLVHRNPDIFENMRCKGRKKLRDLSLREL